MKILKKQCMYCHQYFSRISMIPSLFKPGQWLCRNGVACNKRKKFL